MSELRLLPMAEVCRKVGVTRTHIYRLIKGEGFPKPLHLSAQSRAWRNDEVDQWIEERSALRDPPEADPEADPDAE